MDASKERLTAEEDDGYNNPLQASGVSGNGSVKQSSKQETIAPCGSEISNSQIHLDLTNNSTENNTQQDLASVGGASNMGNGGGPEKLFSLIEESSVHESTKSDYSIPFSNVSKSHSEGDYISSHHAVQNTGLAYNPSICRIRKRICLTEVCPSHSSIQNESDQKWKFPINVFSSRKHGKQDSDKTLPKSVRSFYKAQDELIDTFEEMQLEMDDAMANSESELRIRKMSSILAKVTFGVNLTLLIAKAVASGLSGSLSVISSLVDSAVDLLSGIIIWWTNRAVKNRDPFLYPQGRTKLEPVGIVILSVVMALASVQLIIQSITNIVDFANDEGSSINMDAATIAIISSTIVIKFILFMVCRRFPSPSLKVLAQDHRNDVLSNIVALTFGLIGYHFWPYADPMGGIIISLYIAYSWWRMGYEQIKLLTGYTANPKFLQKVTWICLNHNEAITQIDTVRAFHFGNNFIVEVDIVLPETMTLKEAHNIGEPLQQKLERLPEVERAFVHLDYEFLHNPSEEHKIV